MHYADWVVSGSIKRKTHGESPQGSRPHSRKGRLCVRSNVQGDGGFAKFASLFTLNSDGGISREVTGSRGEEHIQSSSSVIFIPATLSRDKPEQRRRGNLDHDIQKSFRNTSQPCGRRRHRSGKPDHHDGHSRQFCPGTIAALGIRYYNKRPHQPHNLSHMYSPPLP